MISVELTEEQSAEASDVGMRRGRLADKRGWKDRGGFQANEGLVSHRLGARGECAFAVWAGLPWNGFVLNPHQLPGDVAHYEIRTTPLPHGRLVIMPTDVETKATRPFVLALANAYDRFTLAGWYLPADGMNQQWWRDYPGRSGRWFVPRSELHTMESLPGLPARLVA